MTKWLDWIMLILLIAIAWKLYAPPKATAQ